ncbi:MAG TPA: DUF2865 domain-containing protein [Bradyrhizobium sp.]|jgi:hypothetical protein|nr:DUF2865 domain-containing protein [Bradyrhizobium sp.]
MIANPGRLALGGAILLAAMATTPSARAEDFLSALFGAFGVHRPQPPMTPLPFAGEENTAVAPDGSVPRARIYSGSSQAYCVRTCDGRYFPISGAGNQSRAASCSSFCPASETKVVYGGNIDSAVTESGKPYSELQNAFRYRNELVAGCTCNGKDPVGLAAVKIEDDPTLRRGDIVAGPDGLMVAGRGADRRGASLELAPAPEQIRSHYRRAPVVAAQ